MSEYLAAICLLIVFVLMFSLIVYLVRSLVITANQRCEALQQENERLRAELSEFETIKNRVRQTGPTLAGLEDAMAALMRVQLNREAEQVYLDASMRTLQQIRKGPYAYDPETPTGHRKEFE